MAAAPGLERDHHHDQKSGLERHYHSDEFPTVYSKQERVQPLDYPKESNPSCLPVDSFSKVNRVCGLRRTTFWLSLGLISGLVLAAVAAGIAGAFGIRNHCGSTETWVEYTTRGFVMYNH